MMNLSFQNLFLILLSAFFNAASVLIFKYRLNQTGLSLKSFESLFNSSLTFIRSPLAIIGGIMFVFAPFVFLLALSKTNVTIAYPVLVALNFAFVIILSILFLSETLNATKIVSILLIIISLYLFYR